MKLWCNHSPKITVLKGRGEIDCGFICCILLGLKNSLALMVGMVYHLFFFFFSVLTFIFFLAHFLQDLNGFILSSECLQKLPFLEYRAGTWAYM